MEAKHKRDLFIKLTVTCPYIGERPMIGFCYYTLLQLSKSKIEPINAPLKGLKYRDRFYTCRECKAFPGEVWKNEFTRAIIKEFMKDVTDSLKSGRPKKETIANKLYKRKWYENKSPEEKRRYNREKARAYRNSEVGKEWYKNYMRNYMAKLRAEKKLKRSPLKKEGVEE